MRSKLFFLHSNRAINIFIYKLMIMSVIAVLLLQSCAEPNNPISILNPNDTTVVDSSSISLTHFYVTQGYAMDISITDSMLYIAEDQAGFSIYNLNSAEQEYYYDNHSNFQNYRLIHADEENNWLFVYNRYGNTSIQAFDIEIIDDLTILPPIIGQTQKIDKIIYEKNPEGGLKLSWIKELDDGSQYQYDGIYNGYWMGGTGNPIIFDYSAVDFDVDSTYLYTACEQLGVQLVSLDSGIVKGEYNTTGEAISVLVDENLVYIGDKQEGLSIVNFSDIDNPVLLYQYDTAGYAQSVDFNDNYLVVGSGGGGVYLFDISDKADVKFIDRYDPNDFGYTYKVVLKNNKIFAATKKGVYELEIATSDTIIAL